MNLRMKPGIRMASGGDDRQTQVERLIAAGTAIIELQHRKASPNKRRYFNFEDMRIEPYERPNSNEIVYRTYLDRHGVLVFEPDENRILHAYMIDTERNRRMIALMLDDNEFFVVRRHDINGVDLKVVSEIKALHDDIKKIDKTKRVTDAQNRSDAIIPRASNPGDPEPAREAYAYEDVLADVYAENSTTVAFLSKRDPKGWRTSADHEELLGAKIRERCAKMGVEVPGKPAPANAGQPETTGQRTIPGPELLKTKARAKAAAVKTELETAVPDLATQI